jgi:hypothetical protein
MVGTRLIVVAVRIAAYILASIAFFAPLDLVLPACHERTSHNGVSVSS